MKKYVLLFLLFCGTLFGQTTDRFERPFYRSGSDTLITGASIYIVNSSTGDSLLLTEHATKPGVYYRNSVAYGSYKIYVNGALSTSSYPFGISRARSFIEAIDSDSDNKIEAGSYETGSIVASDLSNTLDLSGKSVTLAAGELNTSEYANESVTLEKLSSTLQAGFTGGLPSNAYLPDDITLELVIDGGDTTFSIKNGGVTYNSFDQPLKDSLKADNTTIHRNTDGKYEVKNNGIGFNKLSVNVQNSIGGELYSFQDPKINTALQMFPRWASYVHEKYYVEDSVYYDFNYDVTDSTFEQDRRTLIEYTYMVMALHKKTGRQIYWNKLISLTSALLSIADSTIQSGGSTYAKTISQNPHAGVDGWKNWGYDDVFFHICLYYIYSQEPVEYAGYLQHVKDFADVVWSYIEKSPDNGGWGWAYQWNDAYVGGSGDRINVNTPLMYWYLYLQKNGVFTPTITTARCDSIIDSVYTHIQTGFVSDGAGNKGWVDDLSDVTPDYGYSQAVSRYYIAATETYGDTTWAPTGFSSDFQDYVNYAFRNTATTLLNINEFYVHHMLYLAEFCRKWGFTFPNDFMWKNAGATALNLKPFGDGYLPLKQIPPPRRGTAVLSLFPAFQIQFYNDTNYGIYTHQFPYVDRATWTPTSSIYYYADGTTATDRNGIGVVSSSLTGGAYYYTGDTSPGSDTTNFSYNSTNGLLTYTSPQASQTKAVGYTIKKPLGTNFKMVIPDTNGVSLADSVWIYADSTQGAGIYLFYTNTSGALDTINIRDVSSGDSITVDGTKGVYLNVVSSASPVAGQQGFGFICNKSTLRLKWARSVKNIVLKTTASTMPDSAMFFTHRGGQPNFYLVSDIPQYWQRIFLHVAEIFGSVQRAWDYGITNIGILKNEID